jgi:hypothetical protein
LVAQEGGRLTIGGGFDLAEGSINLVAQNAGSLLEMPALRKLSPDSLSIGVTDGARATFPMLTDYSGANTRHSYTSWTVQGAGSLLEMPALIGFLTPQFPVSMGITAQAGAKINLGGLTAIPSGSLQILADGNGSVVDLHSAGRFDMFGGSGSIQAANSGAITLAPIFLASNAGLQNVASWGEPAVTGYAYQSDLLCATPGLAVTVETRPQGNAAEPWRFLARIPIQTNQIFLRSYFQVDPSLEFRVRELVADPPEINLERTADGKARATVFGLPGSSYRLDSSPGIFPAAVWTSFQKVVTLTHPFEQIEFDFPAGESGFFRAARQ